MHDDITSSGLDVLLCVIPKVYPDAPTVGPAVLKSHLIQHGYTCKVVDFNIDLFNALAEDGLHSYYYFENDSIFFSEFGGDVNEEFDLFYQRYKHVFERWLELIRYENPRYLGLSMLSGFSLSAGMKLSELIRDTMPHIDIIWGGAALLSKNMSEYDRMKRKGLFKHFVFGDGEESLIQLMKGNLAYDGIDSVSPNQVRDMDDILVPNYDDICWDSYPQGHHRNVVYLTGSKGCVKRCNFCNVYNIWPDYKFRSAANIVDEIKVLRKLYDRKTIKFTDSLINGSMKNFRNLLHEMIRYREVDADFEWNSQWIIRSRSQSSEEDFRLIKESGCAGLKIGLESFNQDIRFHMGKKFTNDDMWWCFDNLNKCEIPFTLMMIVGYPIETEEHHLHTLEQVRKMFDLGYASKRLPNGSNLVTFSFSNAMYLDESQPLWKLVRDDLSYFNSSIDWGYNDNTLEVRTRWLKEIHNLILELGKQQHDIGWMARKAINTYEKRVDGTSSRLWIE